jgi:predicted permease
MVRSIMQDVRYALRQLRKSPGFAGTAVAVLALGIGANIAIFTLLSGIILRPLPYAHPDRVVAVELSGDMPFYAFTYANILRLRDSISPHLAVGAQFNSSTISVVGPGGRLQLQKVELDGGMLPLLGASPAMGRTFTDEETQPGRHRVVLIGSDVWRRLYDSDQHIVGKTVTINQETYTILGVMPKGFAFPFGESMQIWSPTQISATDRTALSGEKANSRGSMYARIPDGLTIAQLTAALNHAQALVAKESADKDLPAQLKVTGYQESLNHNARKPLLLLDAVVLGIWALACLNVMSLMLARAVSRSREQAVRSALGASRVRLLQQSIVESVLLSAIGAVAGLALGESAIKLLWRQIERNLPLTDTVHVDWRVIACLVAIGLLTASVIGIFPALRASGRNVQSSLHGMTSTASLQQNRTRELLVIGQLALTLVFLVGAGLFLRTIHALRQVPLGFHEQNVLTGGVILNQTMNLSNSTADAPNIVRIAYLPLLEKLHAIPGVRDAALSSVLPMRSEFEVMLMGKIDHKDAPKGHAPMAQGRLASAGLVRALGIPMIRGRFFTEDDTDSSPVVVVVNQAFAQKYFSGQDPVGHIFGMGKGPFADARIVGVIGDVKQTKVTDATKPEVYFCLAQIGPGKPLYGIATAFIQVAIRGAVPAETLRSQFDRVLHEVAPDATTTGVKTIHEAVEDSFGSQTLIAHLLETFAGLALMIASVGLYGLLSFAVAQRTREIGVRLALGAPQTGILALVLRRALMLVVIGLAAGTLMAWFAARLANSYMFGVKPHDLLTFTAVALVLAIASFFAAWLPARRAAAVDPIQALRSE